jgi:predicted CXXCH cytochrome family protein
MGETVQHAPFASGECSTCHEPHGAEQAGLASQAWGELCSSCHTADASFKSVHRGYPVEEADCQQCHDPHASEWGGILVDNQRDLCFVCHPSVAPLSLKPVQHNPFLYDNCSGCHEPHASNNTPLLLEQQPSLCYICHPSIQNDFLKRSSHPVGTIQLTCADCHNPHAADYSALLAARDNEMCYECHAEAVGESRAIRTSYDDSAHVGTLCIECHTPHGSDWEPILRAQNPDVCLRCHPGYEGNNKHPVRPVFYDVVAGTGLTCSSTCHEPHGTAYTRMLIGWNYPADGFCMQCHLRVGIDF